jgi:hypothetical protein
MLGPATIVSGAFGDDEGDVVVLLVGAEALELFDDGCEGVFGGHGFVLL